MADDLNDVIERAALDLQGMLNTGFISEDDEGLYEAFGGKKGAGRVAVPDKLTDKQILAYFDFIGTPLTSKSEKTSVLNAVRENMVDRPTSINKNKSTAGAMVDALRVELKELQSFKTVDPDVLGGKAGKPISVPKKFTAEQTVAFMKQFPNMFPLADENAYFGIARALTEESPDLFDVASFDAYEEKFGKTMEMQEKGASASKNITTAKTPEAANKPVADLDPKTATLREVAEAYAKKSKRKDFVSPTIQYFKDIADEPGSALRLFEKDAEGFTLLSKTFGNTDENAPVKVAMQNIRAVGLLLKENLGPDTPEYKLLPDKAPNTDLNNRIFGRIEPSKAEAQIAINPNRKVQSQFFSGVAKYLDDPATRPAALALFTKYPLCATIVVTVEPSDTTTDCQLTSGLTVREAPNAVDEPLIVIAEFDNFALETAQSANLVDAIAQSGNSVATFITPSDTFAVVTALSAIPLLGSLLIAITLFITIDSE